MTDKPALPPECGRALGLAVFAVMNKLGGETMVVDEDDDDVALGKLAQVGPRLVIVERPSDRATGKPRRFTAYRIDETEPGKAFKLDPGGALFVLHETHLATPPDYHLQLVRDPHEWFNSTMAAIHVALEPVARRPN